MLVIKLNDTDYRALNRFANSDLSEFKRLLIGDNRKLPSKAFKLGSVFHQMLLEPETIASETWQDFTEEQHDQLLSMYHAALQNKTVDAYLSSDRREEVQLWEAEGLPCKSKLDLIKDRKVIDIKTTSARSYQAFVSSILKYDYNRQAAFYADSIGLKEFAFVGVQKQEPFDIYIVELTDWQGPESLEAGRHLYRQLLRQIKKSNFTPTSWKETVKTENF